MHIPFLCLLAHVLSQQWAASTFTPSKYWLMWDFFFFLKINALHYSGNAMFEKKSALKRVINNIVVSFRGMLELLVDLGFKEVEATGLVLGGMLKWRSLYGWQAKCLQDLRSLLLLIQLYIYLVAWNWECTKGGQLKSSFSCSLIG